MMDRCDPGPVWVLLTGQRIPPQIAGPVTKGLELCDKMADLQDDLCFSVSTEDHVLFALMHWCI